MGGIIDNKLINNKLIIQIIGLHLCPSGKVPNANNGIFVVTTDHFELKINQLIDWRDNRPFWVKNEPIKSFK